MIRLYLLDPTGTTVLAYLDGATGVKHLAELNGVGSGSFKLSGSDPKAALIATHQIVRVQVDNTPIGYWLIRQIDETLVDDSGGDTDVSVSGPGILALLDREVVRSVGGDTTALVSFAQSYGEGWMDLWSGRTALPFGFSFDDTNDSGENRWPVWPAAGGINTAVKCNATMLDVMKTMVGYGIDQWLDGANFCMAAVPAPVGSDLTATVIMRQGRDIRKLTRLRSGSDLANVVFAIESTTDYVEYTNAAGIAAYGRLETGLDSTGKPDAATIGQALADELAEPLESIYLAVNTATFVPFSDYTLGDTIRVSTTSLAFDFRITALLLTQAETGDVLVEMQSDNVANVPQTFLERVNQQLTFSLAKTHHAQD